ncbi:MAG TPA: phosphoglucosamine mutase [Candidatus Hydromicrobium sp.]
MEDLRKLFGTDGIRGIANKELTAELALKVGKAGAKYLVPEGKRGKILIGRDPRPSGDFIENALMSGILSAGHDVLRAGIITTPAVALLTKILNADGGVVISASHNPLGDNGIKFFGRGGQKLTDYQEKAIEDYILDTDIENALPVGVGVGRFKAMDDAVDIYLDYIFKYFNIDLNGYKIAVDCANGSSSALVTRALTKLGAKVLDFNTDLSGENINKNCGSTHPEVLKNIVLENKVDIGFSYDGDGDRVISCDSGGRILDGDSIIAFCALDMHKNGNLRNNCIVTTVMANMGFHNVMKDSGIKVYKTKVGDRYVLEKMIEADCALGGEQSGHIIFKDISPTGDGLISTLEFLKVVLTGKSKISDIYDIFPRYPQLLENIKVEDKSKVMMSRILKEKIAEMEKVLGEEGRIVLRPSGTEPVIRVMVEAKTMDIVNDVVSQLSAVIKQCNDL